MPYKPKTQLYQHLSEKWIAKHKSRENTLWQKHKKALSWVVHNLSPRQLDVGSLGGLMLLSSPSVPLPISHETVSAQTVAQLDKNVFLISDLSNILPKDVRELTGSEEKEITAVLTRNFNFPVKAEINGKRLNQNYGFIGQEQHLARFPGDTISNHFDNDEEVRQFSSFGMAPGLGAWGYFARSETEFSEKDKQREKYYIAVQTFLAPGFNENFIQYRDFFKYRKMFVLNPNNGKAMVVVIGDAGPSEWTGKHLGGSPEVVNYLQRQDGAYKGLVLYFFIDDPEDKVPLGPVKI